MKLRCSDVVPDNGPHGRLFVGGSRPFPIAWQLSTRQTRRVREGPRRRVGGPAAQALNRTVVAPAAVVTPAQESPARAALKACTSRTLAPVPVPALAPLATAMIEKSSPSS